MDPIAETALIMQHNAVNRQQLFKKIVWEHQLHTPDEFVRLEEAIKPNRSFGTNSPTFDNGLIEYRKWTLTATKTPNGVFLIYFDPAHEVQFAPVEDWTTDDSLAEMFAKTNFRRLGAMSYASFASLLGTVMGAIIDYITHQKPGAVTFTGLDPDLTKLYGAVIRARGMQDEMQKLGYSVVQKGSVFLIKQEKQV